MALLLLGAVGQKQLGRPQRVGHHHRHRRRHAAAGDFHHHLGMGIGRELQPAIALWNDHAEETVGLDEIPDLGRQIVALVRDVPVVEHPAQRFRRPVEEGLLVVAERRRRHGRQPGPVGAAAEQLRLPADGTGLDGRLLGIGHRWQCLGDGLHHRLADPWAAERRPQQHHCYQQVQQPDEHDADAMQQADRRQHPQRDRHAGQPYPVAPPGLRQQHGHDRDDANPDQPLHIYLPATSRTWVRMPYASLDYRRASTAYSTSVRASSQTQQQAYQAAHPPGEQRRLEIAPGGALADLRQGRIGSDHPRHVADAHAFVDGQYPGEN